MQSTSNSTAIPSRVAGFELEELDDEIMLFHSETETIITVNQTAALVWGLCDGQRSIDAIISMLQAAYSKNAASIHQDVPRIIQELVQEKAVMLVINESKSDKQSD